MKRKVAFSKTVNYPLTVATHDGHIFLVVKETKGRATDLKLLQSSDGLEFHPAKRKLHIKAPKGRKVQIKDNAHLRISGLAGDYVMTYVEGSKSDRHLTAAHSTDFFNWEVAGSSKTIDEPAAVVADYLHHGQHVLYVGDALLQVAATKSFKRYKIFPDLLLAPREGFFDGAPLTVLSATKTAGGLLVLYDCSYATDTDTIFQVGAVLFSLDDPTEIIWRSQVPVWESSHAEVQSIRPLGAIYSHQYLFFYWYVEGEDVLAVRIRNPFIRQATTATARKLPIKRHHANPILEPRDGVEWEAAGTFNPAALQTEDRVHLVYRAVSSGGVSMMGYASSRDGFSIDERSKEPVYVPRTPHEGASGRIVEGLNPYQSGFGWGGCEDPKLTRLGDRVYMTYVAYNGWGPPRAALTSIAVADFLAQKWHWDEPTLISPPDVVTKSACLLPEQVNGQYVMFHRIFPDILIDYLDDLAFNDDSYLTGHKRIRIRPAHWDSRKLSVGATPIKTDAGWLTIYHAVDDRDPGRYKMGAMLLDLHDPSRVLYRTGEPILEPDMHYENSGKPGVVYPCGAAVVDGELIVYYGGGDWVVCAAHAPLSQVIDHLMDHEPEYATERIAV